MVALPRQRCTPLAAHRTGLAGKHGAEYKPAGKTSFGTGAMTSSTARVSLLILAGMLAATGLAACETAGTSVATETAMAPEPPMTRTRAAERCWMSTEKGYAALPLDKRADVVDKCIEQKMKATSGNAEPAPAGSAPEAKKKKQASAAAEKKKPAAAGGEKDQKPADADVPDKKP